MQDALVLIAQPAFESDRLSRDQFAASRLLMREHGSGSRHVVEMALENAGFKLKSFKNVMNLDSTEAIKSAVEVGLGIGFVQSWAPFFPHFAHRAGTARSGGRVQDIRARSCPTSRQCFTKAAPFGQFQPISSINR
jgi:DNA-binding transcriptional LysR family regulator